MFAQQLKGHLDLLLLAVLADGPAHGYAVIATLRERSGGELDLPEGTVYPALHRLEQAGLVGSRWSAEQGRRRRVYSVTAAGRRSLVEQQLAWDRFRDAVQTVLGHPPGRRRRAGTVGGFAAGATRRSPR